MKALEIVALLSLWLLSTFADQPSSPLDSLSLDHPDRIMEKRGQLNCLKHNFLDLDVLRRHEAAIFVYPEIRVGCETISVKPFQPPMVPPPEPDDMWVYQEGNLNKKRPTRPEELAEKVQKYFVIDMYGNETQVQPGSSSSVTVETYDFSRVKFFEDESVIFPSRLTTKLQTFRFDQLCFPVACYEPGQKVAEECVSVSQWLSAEEAGTITFECLQNTEKCDYTMGMIANERLKFKGKSGSILASNITTYCSLETRDRPRLGPLRTSGYTGLQALLSNRFQVPSDTLNDPDDQDISKRNLRTSALLSIHKRTSMYKDEGFITSCIVAVPVEPPYNTSFAVDFFVAQSRYAAEKPIRPGRQLMLNVKVKEDLKPDGSSFRYNDAVWEVKFEELCFPAECYQERTPAEAATCQLQESETRKHQVPGAMLYYKDPSSGVQKLLWPTASYYNKFTL